MPFQGAKMSPSTSAITHTYDSHLQRAWDYLAVRENLRFCKDHLLNLGYEIGKDIALIDAFIFSP
jgi:hypothetical protein